MVRNIVKAIVVVAAMVGMVGVIQSAKNASATPVVVNKIEICHSRQPNESQGGGQGAQNNPYGPSREDVSVSAIFGNNGHDSHNGPVFNGTGQDSWGDIIPPFWYMTNGRNPQLVHYEGKNWTTAGQAIWNNDCQFAPQGSSAYTLACEKITLSAPTAIKPVGASYQYYVDGVATALGAKTVTAGNHTITLKVNGVLVDTDNVHVDACVEPGKVTICHRTDDVKNPYLQKSVSQNAVNGEGENDHSHHTGPVATSEAVAQALKDSKTKWGDIIPPFGDYPGLNWTAEGQAIYNNDCNYVVVEGQPNVSTVLVCKDSTSTFTMTLTNSGTASANIVLNGESFTLAGGATTTRDFVDNGSGVKLTLVVNGTTDKTYDGSRAFFCKQGQGGVTVTTGGQGAATGVASLPFTGSAGSQLASLIAIIASVATAIAGYAVRSRTATSL